MKIRTLIVLAFLLIHTNLFAQQAVTVRVDVTSVEGVMQSDWRYFGYDEPNYTYMPHGKELLHELSALSSAGVYLRAHNLLTTGDGTPALKWGSTNVYTEDSQGRPVFNWDILDRIFDAYRDAQVRPFVEIGFMPKALSAHPDPYQHTWPKGSLWTGWAYPPKDYGKWAELVHQWVHHEVERYGARAVASWYWEVWNEPDIGYWQGTREEYFKLYDYTAEAVKRALPQARIGGPATTGPAAPRAAEFLKAFLQHCESGKNYATGEEGAPLDFISFHAKGRTHFVDGHVEMGIANNLQDISRGFEIVASFPKWKRLPIFITESDPEGCAACAAVTHPENGYRNTSQYAAYEVNMQRAALELAALKHVNLGGVLTWAFEYDDQPCFAGFRTLTTCGIDKPVLNAFRMLALASGMRLKVTSTGALPLDTLVGAGTREAPDIGAFATRQDRGVCILMWNYADNAGAWAPNAVKLEISGLPPTAHTILIEHFRIDNNTSNAFTLWKIMGSPVQPSAEQTSYLKTAGQLQSAFSPQWKAAEEGEVNLKFELPVQAVSLVRLSW